MIICMRSEFYGSTHFCDCLYYIESWALRAVWSFVNALCSKYFIWKHSAIQLCDIVDFQQRTDDTSVFPFFHVQFSNRVNDAKWCYGMVSRMWASVVTIPTKRNNLTH